MKPGQFLYNNCKDALEAEALNMMAEDFPKLHSNILKVMEAYGKECFEEGCDKASIFHKEHSYQQQVEKAWRNFLNSKK